MKLKIEQLEPQLAQKLGVPLKSILQDLQHSVPDHYEVRISLLDANRRKKRSDASADNWSPDSGRIEVWFEPGDARTPVSPPESSAGDRSQTISPSGVVKTAYVSPSEADMLRVLVAALDRAESRPGWNFVPLRKFRDEILPAENSPLMQTDTDRQNVLRSAIEKRLVLVGKVPNPKAPEFPVTTVRLNRLLPEVKALLGQTDDEDKDTDFRPIEIRGEPLSTTILRERR
jgi:hypothetical protein